MSPEKSERLAWRVAHVLRIAHLLVDQWPEGAQRLTAGVIRPLTNVLGRLDPAPVYPVTESSWPELLRFATNLLTALGGGADVPSEVLEATAALQDMDLRVVRANALSNKKNNPTSGNNPASGNNPEQEAVRQRIAELTALFAAERPYIRVAKDGPYLVAGAKRLQTHLGEPIENRPLVALCRCGASASKPICDGSHVRIGFTGAKADDRVPDRRDTYVGTSITVLDNRGLCQHSGYCTDRLSTVFRADAEPFVSPSGGRLDDIVHAVRACPSGALSFAIDGWEVRAHVDPADRPPAVEVSQHGPYRVTGGMTLLDDRSVRHAAPQGASTEHYALCRCGQSKNKPFCSGRHWDVNFTDPLPAAEPTLFEWMGGFPSILRLTRLFYRKYVPADPLLAPLFGRMSPDHPERVASWLAEVFGGPSFYGDNYGGYNRMLGEHIGKRLTEPQRERWASLMYQAANEAMLPADADFRAAFCAYVEWGTRLAVENSQTESKPPLNMPMPRWGWVNGATPWSRVNALTVPEDEDEQATLPVDDEPVSYEKHIRTLFRDRDRKSMQFAMDLWSYEDVRTHANAILTRVSDGTMPCDGAWPQAKIDCLRRWINEGMPS
jgi:CDGSH-type Zn-finger protein/truncated hemoglobin YjbI